MARNTHEVYHDSRGDYIIIKLNDNLTHISEEFNTSINKLAALNSDTVKDVDLIITGNKLYIENNGSGGSTPSSDKTKDPNIVVLGQMSTDSSTLYAAWTWSKESVTEKYETKWEYDRGDKVGSEIHWYIDTGSAPDKQTTWSIPAGTKTVKFSIKPIAKKKSDGKSDEFEQGWSSKVEWTNKTPITTPSGLKVDMEGCKLTASVSGLETSCPEATHIAFEVVENNQHIWAQAAQCTNKIVLGYASYSWTVPEGGEYKVRCYAYASEDKTGTRSNWTAYSDNYPSIPANVPGFREIRAVDKTSVYLEWVESSTADLYNIEWYDDKTNIGLTDPVGEQTVENKQTACKIINLTSGHEYFFRIRAKNAEGESDWSEPQSIIIGTKPSAPTTWSSTTTVVVGEELVLYWVHNSEDESSQSEAELKMDITIDGATTSQTYTIKNLTDDESKDKTRSCSIDTNTGYISWVEDDGIKTFYLGVTFKETAKIEWRVRTRGIAVDYSDYSTPRTVDVYSPPTLELRIGTTECCKVEEINGVYTKINERVDVPSGSAVLGIVTTDNEQVYRYVNSEGETEYYCYVITDLSLEDEKVSDLPIVESFPFYVSAVPGPKTQSPIGYHLSITANTEYETADSIGNFKMVSAGEQIYSKYFDVKHDLLVELSAGNIDLQNNISYTITCTVSMDSGLTAEASQGFTVDWTDLYFTPNAEVGIYSDSFTATIRPYCENRRIERRKVEYTNRSYIVTDVVLEYVYGKPVSRAVTITGEQVYKGVTADGEDVYFCEVDVVIPITDVYLAVYRREFDGSFTELASMLDGAANTAITDPHPALDYARYRIVATSKSTGAVSFNDLPGVPVDGIAVVIQWSEEWTTFDSPSRDRSAESTWSGSMLMLPYNIDVSDDTSPEVELVQYIGRKHPVSYYGTQRGQHSTWNVVIEKDDEETLYGLRRLAMWMGDVYVREPSGSGYWANIKVSFSQKHRDLTIPVTLDITRVEGGV